MSHVIVDEIHERDVSSDFIMVVLRDMVYTYPDLRIILMSATIDTTLFSNYFNNCPIIEVPGRAYPVTEYYLEDCIQMTNFMPPPDSRFVFVVQVTTGKYSMKNFVKLICLRFHEILIWPALQYFLKFSVVMPYKKVTFTKFLCIKRNILPKNCTFFLGKGKTKAGTMMMMTKEAKWTPERMTKICLTFAPMNMGKNLPQKSMTIRWKYY